MGIGGKASNQDVELGEPKREYIQEIMEALNNEPELDESKTYSVCEMKLNSSNEVALVATGQKFFQHIIAEEWIRQSGARGKQYVILEVLTQIVED